MVGVHSEDYFYNTRMKQLRQYQEQALQFAMEHNSGIILPYGTGKTLIGCHAISNIDGPKVVIAPKRIKEQWVATLASEFPDIVVHQNPSKVVSYKSSVLVTHYEQFIRDSWLQDMPWQLMVLDEAHRIKNPKAKRTSGVKKAKPALRLALTATPLHKSVHDLWSLLNWLDLANWRSRRKFFDRYVVVSTNYMGWQTVEGSKNLGELSDKIKDLIFARSIEDVAPEMPLVTEQIVQVPLNRDQQAIYKKIDEADDIVVDDMLIPNTLAKMTRLQQVSSLPRMLDYDIDSAKVEWVRDFIEDQSDQVLFFTRFRQTAEAIRQLDPKRFGIVMGGQPPEGVEAFLKGGKQFLVGTIASMSEGFDFPNAMTAVFVDTTYSQIQMSQATHRHQRISNPIPKNVIYLQSSPVDQDMYDTFKKGKSEFDLVLGYLTRRGLSHKLLRNN